MKILFPSEPFNVATIDSSFLNEYESAKLVGFECYLFDHDEFVRSGEFKTNLPKNTLTETDVTKIILRSWMLSSSQYESLSTKLLNRAYVLFNTTEQYLQTHYFPNAYKFISDDTSKVWWTGEINNISELNKIDWKSVRAFLGGDVLIKDYVKSEKGNPDLFILKNDLSNEEFHKRVIKFIEARGKLFNYGLVFKSVEELKKYAGQTNEWRIFFINKKAVTINFNSEQLLDVPKPNGMLILKCAAIANEINSNFLTIDIAEKANGEWMILETGDGQVSGLAAQENTTIFYSKLLEKI